MCDRSKVEVLARELCIEYWNGKASEGAQYTNYDNVKDYVDNNWTQWKKHAKKLIKVLEEHN